MLCLTPRALRDSVRPRRLSGRGGRPLNFTVRRHEGHLMFIRSLAIGLAISISAFAGEPDPNALQALMVKLMVETKVVAVELSGPAADFRPDNDPNTLEIVFLTRKQDGPSRVSDDGEVIYLYKPSDKEQQSLINKAFEIRARRRLGGV